MIDKTNFAKKLTELRNKCGLSQNRLADMLFISGQAVSKWENANSLPDIELLLPLSQILGVSVDCLLGCDSMANNAGSNNPEIMNEAINSFDLSDEKIDILIAMSGSLSREYLYKAAKYMEKDLLEYKLYLELTSNIENTKNFYKKEIKLQALDKNALLPFSQSLSNLTLQAVNKGYNPINEIIELMKCPVCGKSLMYTKIPDEEYICCGEHRFDVNDGVVDFKTLEIHGYTWSSWLRGYEDFKNRFGWPIEKTASDLESLPLSDKMIINELVRTKPPIIMEIGSGCAAGIRKFIKFINWECIIILTDLSHRILKYDKRFIDETLSNSKIKIVYLACDVKNLPFRVNVIPCVISYGGYEGVFYDYFMPFKEVYRVLIVDGTNIYTISLVSDRQNVDTQKWLKLIKDFEDPDMPLYYNTIYDINEWNEKIKSFGYSEHTLVKVHDELPAPDTNVFPYDYEIGRWQALAFVSAKK